jgi:hypothetical protein
MRPILGRVAAYLQLCGYWDIVSNHNPADGVP